MILKLTSHQSCVHASKPTGFSKFLPEDPAARPQFCPQMSSSGLKPWKSQESLMPSKKKAGTWKYLRGQSREKGAAKGARNFTQVQGNQCINTDEGRPQASSNLDVTETHQSEKPLSSF